MSFSRFGLAAVAVTSLVCVSLAAPQVVDAQDAVAPSQVEANIKGTVGLGIIGAELGFVIPALAGLDETWAYIVFPVLGAGGGAVGGYFLIDNGDHVEASIAVLAASMALIMPTMVITLSLTQYDPDDELDDRGETIDEGEAPSIPGTSGDDAAAAEEAPASEESAEESGDAASETLQSESIEESADVPTESDGSESPEPPTETPEPPAGGEGSQKPTARLDVGRVQRLARAGAGAVRFSEDGLILSVPGVALRSAYSPQEVARYGATSTSEVHVSLLSGVF